MTVTTVNPVVVDTVEFSLKLLPSQYSFLMEQFASLKELQKSFTPQVKINVYPKSYQTSLTYKLQGQKKYLARIEIGSTKTKSLYAKLTLQLGSCTVAQFQVFQEHMSILMDFFEYKKLYQFGAVTRIDLAVDVSGRHQYEILPWKLKVSKSHFYMRADGSRGSLYIGSPASDRRFCIYDKKRQLKRQGVMISQKKLTRVEVRLRKLKCTAADLLTAIDNPFTGLNIAELGRARAQNLEDGWWQDFLSVAEEQGCSTALMQLPKAQRAVARARLTTVAVGWWNPPKLLPHIALALQKLVPSG